MKTLSFSFHRFIRRLRLMVIFGAIAAMSNHRAAAQTSIFTYQGRLMDNGAPATGNYDMEFTLFTTDTGNVEVTAGIIVNPVAVAGGLFTVPLNFSSSLSFNGSDRWLEIEVRPAGNTAAYTKLVPRQKITSAPYSIFAKSASNATSAGTAAALTGNVSASQVQGGTLSPAVIGDGTLPAAKLSNDSITGGQIAGNAIGSTELADNAVTSGKLASNIGLWSKSGSTIFNTSDAVGIGTSTPRTRLDVKGSGAALRLTGPAGGGSTVGIDLTTYDPETHGMTLPSSRILATDDGFFSSHLDFFTKDWQANTLPLRLRIAADGRIGINNTNPLALLDIQGGADSKGDNDMKSLAFSWHDGGYRHYIRSRHNAAGDGTGNALDFYLNSGTTAGASTRPGTGNVHGLTIGEGKVGIGTTAPAAPLDIDTGSGGRFQIRNDGPTPAINLTGGGAPGVLRVRNAIEVIASDDATRAGKLDVRNTAGNPTITLDGASGKISAANMPGVEFVGDYRFPPSLGYSVKSVSGPDSFDIDSIDVDTPASGFLIITGFVSLWIDGPTPGGSTVRLNLYNSTAGSYLLETEVHVVEQARNHPLHWAMPVPAGRTSIKMNGSFGTSTTLRISAYTLTAIYVPIKL